MFTKGHTVNDYPVICMDESPKQLIEEGFESCLERQPSQRVYEKKVDGVLKLN